jgi:hypothetical protein
VGRLDATLFRVCRQLLSAHLQRRWAEGLPTIPLAYDVSMSAHAANLVGWAPQGKSSPWWNIETWHFR